MERRASSSSQRSARSFPKKSYLRLTASWESKVALQAPPLRRSYREGASRESASRQGVSRLERRYERSLPKTLSKWSGRLPSMGPVYAHVDYASFESDPSLARPRVLERPASSFGRRLPYREMLRRDAGTPLQDDPSAFLRHTIVPINSG